MQCPECSSDTIKYGKDRYGNQRYRCKACSRTVNDTPHADSPIAPHMRLPMDRAVLVLSMLVEGMSIRATERVSGHHRDTIMRLLVLAGDRCEKLLDEMLRDIEVEDVQADELWSYVGMKQKTKKAKGITDPEIGDAYTYVAMERDSKLIVAHHVGERDWNDTEIFVSKLAKATTGPFQLSTDGWQGYEFAVTHYLGHRASYAQIIKEFGSETEGARRYSPPKIIGTRKVYRDNYPDPDKVCTSHVERQNLTVRMGCRRFTRLTNGWSKKFANLKAAVSLHFAHFNLCRIHSSIRCTPAMKSGVATTIWSLADLLAA